MVVEFIIRLGYMINKICHKCQTDDVFLIVVFQVELCMESNYAEQLTQLFLRNRL